ncbi:MAG TPA: DUF3379 family protein [Burkholderiales bacterium]|nr:DUF3379 family protein [Burkholderiales bacterium]
MKCLEFHRAKLADPRQLHPPAQEHLAQCAACAAFAKSVDEAERQLERSLAVPVPDGLADRVLLRVGAPRRPVWKVWALAASVVLGAGLALSAMLYRPAPAEHYARQAIEHVAMEPESFQTVNASDTPALSELLRATGARLKAPLDAVRYVKLCPVEGGGTALHIVVDTPEGLATLLIVPGQPLAKVEQAASREWNALARPAGRGHYAVVTTSPRATAQADRLVRERIDWDA